MATRNFHKNSLYSYSTYVSRTPKNIIYRSSRKKPYYTYYTPICYTKAFPKLLPSNGSLYRLAAKQVELCVTNLINELGFP